MSEGNAWRPLRHLTLDRELSQAARLTCDAALVEISALAEDLLRLRVTRKKSFAPRRSWAVMKKIWPAVPVAIHATNKQVTVQTAAGRFTLRLADGAWQVEDAQRLTLFSAAGEKTGFADEQGSTCLKLVDNEKLFGLGETSGPFDKRGLVREFWNADALGHASCIHASLRNLYVSIPFAISYRDGRMAGLFWDNPGRQVWDLGQRELDQWQLRAETGDLDLYFFLGPQLADVTGRFSELTGRMPLPPRWALGYQQSRYSYPTRERVEEIARLFRRKQIPCDALHLDIHHMDDYRVFTFGKAFPRPKEMLARLARRGFKAVAIVDPGVKDDRKFAVLKRGKALDAFVKAPKGRKDFVGRVWAGKSRFPDFTNAEVRAWWAKEQARFQKLGVAGFWNDMNEPATFDPPKTLPGKCVHRSDHGRVSHAEIHNAYGLQMARASRKGALEAAPERRPFIISRAGYAGIQRYAAVWTGDNSSTWEHLAESVPMLLNLSLSGVPFCGADIGGFLDSATGELLARWTQLAAFTPFFRNHSNIESRDQEPWAFGPGVENICRYYITMRYQLLPYLYGLFAEANRTGVPIMRPLGWHYQNDPVAMAASDQFLLGADLLVAPILRPGAVARSVYLPRGTWFNFWTGEAFDGFQHVVAEGGMDVLPLFVRGGALLPMVPPREFIDAQPDELVNLHVWPGERSLLRWYEDDGASESYRRGDWHERDITLARGRRKTEVRWSEARGTRPTAVKTWRIVLREVRREPRVRINGRRVPAHFTEEMRLAMLEVRNVEGAIVMEVR
ncbi:MAG: TIM-barrel domain-containing protein [Verrucomicrobiota bacterium]